MRQGLIGGNAYSGVQRDLVVTGFFFICNWFKLYKYKLG